MTVLSQKSRRYWYEKLKTQSSENKIQKVFFELHRPCTSTLRSCVVWCSRINGVWVKQNTDVFFCSEEKYSTMFINSSYNFEFYRSDNTWLYFSLWLKQVLSSVAWMSMDIIGYCSGDQGVILWKQGVKCWNITCNETMKEVD